MLDIFNFVTNLINFVLCVFSFMAISSPYLINAMLCLSNFKVFVIIFTLCEFNIIKHIINFMSCIFNFIVQVIILLILWCI